MYNVCYNVAGHEFVIESGCDGLSGILSSFAPFLSDGGSGSVLFRMHVGSRQLCAAGRHVYGFRHENMGIEIYRGDDGYTFDITPLHTGRTFRMNADSSFRDVSVCMDTISVEHVSVLSNMLMISYAFASATAGTLLVHASVVVSDGRGYLFLGKSGTGKSTHSRLWLEHIPGSRLLNDDNPVVRVEDGVTRVYGSPWSGKTPCYINRSADVGAFVRLEQAPHNVITRLGTLQSFAALLSSSSTMKWDKSVYDGVCNTITDVVQSVPIYKMECLPDRDAAIVCHDTVGDLRL